MSIRPFVGSSFRSPLGVWVYPEGLGQRTGRHLWVWDPDRPHDLDVDPPIEIPEGGGGFGVWVYGGALSAPPETPSTPSQVAQDLNQGGGNYNTRVTVQWSVPGNFPYGQYGVSAEIESCPDGGDIFTPSGVWAFWAFAGATDATMEASQPVEQGFSWSSTWVRCRIRFYNEFGNGPWSAYSNPSRVTLRSM